MFFVEDVTEWSIENFSGALLSHLRRSDRLVTLARAFAAQPGRSIPHLFERSYDVQAAYSFLHHPEAQPDNLQAGHRELVVEELHQPGVYLLIEDGSDFSWSGKRPVSGLGPIGDGEEGLQGFFLHTVLASRWAGLQNASSRRPPLELIGLADQQYHVREPRQAGSKRRDRTETKAELESYLWERANERIGSAPSDTEVRWVRVCDSAADIYEFLLSCQKHRHGFVVRASKDRLMLDEAGRTTGHLFPQMRTLRASGGFELYLRSRPGRAARNAKLSVSFAPVTLRAPARPGFGRGHLPPIECTAIRVWEGVPPERGEALEWMLLTDAPVTNFYQALECILQYASRWVIEEFHKALKSGLGAERLQMESADALFAAISIMSIVAMRLIDFKERLRVHPDDPAEASGLDPLELQLLSARLDRHLKTVRDVALAVGRIGGHLNRKGDGMPGWKTLWEGWIELQAMAAGARLILQIKNIQE